MHDPSDIKLTPNALEFGVNLTTPDGVVGTNYTVYQKLDEEDVSDNGAKAIKFRVSGEITQYRGKNYLYLRSVTIIPDMGQGLHK